MAKLTFSGIDDIRDLLTRESERLRRNGARAVEAGAQIAQKRMTEAAPVRREAKAGHKGHLKDHIKVGKTRYSTADGYSVDVYPDGKRDDGQRYAAVGFVLEYGKSNMKAQPWMVPAMEQHGEEVNEAMRKELFKD